MKHFITTNIANEKEFKALDLAIDQETARKVALVPESNTFGVMTAAMIDGEFVLVSEYPIEEVMAKALKQA